MNSHNPCGTSWIEMVGDMMMVNVGLNNQVRHLYTSCEVICVPVCADSIHV